MILAIDVGNTNIVVGSLEEEKVLFLERLKTDIAKTEMEYLVILKSILEIYNIKGDDLSGIIISSVVPPLTRILSNAMQKLVHKKPLIVGPGIKTGINIRIDNPGELGADLIVDSAGAMKYYPVPMILIDMGTATTITVLDKSGAYIGGQIMPGVRISIDALTSRTAQLPKIDLEAPKKVICTNTIDCMKSGLIYSQASALDGMIDRIEEELGYACTVVATGGISGRIIPYCRHRIILDDELTLKGLAVIFKKNQ